MKDPYSEQDLRVHMPGTFMPPGLGDKLVDLMAVAHVGGVNDRRVLNQGPSYPIDEILLGPYARSWTAIDYDLSVVERARRMGFVESVQFVHGNIANMPEGWTQAFDLVLNFSTLDNVEPALHEACFQEIARVLAPNGQFLMTYGNHEKLPEKIIRSGGWIEYRFSPREVEEALDKTGLKVTWHDHKIDRATIVACK